MSLQRSIYLRTRSNELLNAGIIKEFAARLRLRNSFKSRGAHAAFRINPPSETPYNTADRHDSIIFKKSSLSRFGPARQLRRFKERLIIRPSPRKKSPLAHISRGRQCGPPRDNSGAINTRRAYQSRHQPSRDKGAAPAEFKTALERSRPRVLPDP